MEQGLIHNHVRILAAVLALAMACAVALGLSLAPPAGAQTPAICDQYPNLPICSGGGGGGNDSDDTDDADAGTAGAAGTAGTAGGSLPFTGYPLTGLMLLLVGLLAAGAATRGYLAIRDRSHRQT